MTELQSDINALYKYVTLQLAELVRGQKDIREQLPKAIADGLRALPTGALSSADDDRGHWSADEDGTLLTISQAKVKYVDPDPDYVKKWTDAREDVSHTPCL